MRGKITTLGVMHAFTLLMSQIQERPHRAAYSCRSKTIRFRCCLARTEQKMIDSKSVHLAACWLHQLVSEPAGFAKIWRRSGEIKLLVQQTVRTALAGEMNARSLASTAHGVACCGKDGKEYEMFTALASAAEWRMGEFNA